MEKLRNAVWARKEQEMLKEVEKQQNAVMEMYTKNLLNNRRKKDGAQIPIGMAKIERRDGSLNNLGGEFQ